METDLTVIVLFEVFTTDKTTLLPFEEVIKRTILGLVIISLRQAKMPTNIVDKAAKIIKESLIIGEIELEDVKLSGVTFKLPHEHITTLPITRRP